MTSEWGLTHPCPVDMKMSLASFLILIQRFLSILEKGRETQREGERNIHVTEKHQWVASCKHPDQEPNPQQGYAP